ncbi:MAG: hypothetical protein ACTHLA_09890 [Asticcacaulis sp.]|uniref:hypothetical protein n=1 Tax=Asticcacaulis sp. TaxID=1872648 RepID=UPI003F7C4DBF
MPFSFGAVWSRFFKLVAENFVAFLILTALLIALPQIIWQYGMYSAFNITSMNWTRHVAGMTPMAIGGGIGGWLIIWLCSMVYVCSVTEVAIVRAVGKPVQMGQILSHAVGNMIPAFIIFVITGILFMLGLVVFIVPGIMFGLAACVSIPAYVGEKGLGLWGAVQRSFSLTKGHRWTLFLIFLVAIIATWIVQGIVEAPFIPSMVQDAMRGVQPSFGLPGILLLSLFSALLSMLWYVFFASIYVTLRESKDKLSPEQTASVF